MLNIWFTLGVISFILHLLVTYAIVVNEGYSKNIKIMLILSPVSLLLGPVFGLFILYILIQAIAKEL